MNERWRSDAMALRWAAADAPWVTHVGEAEQGRLLQLDAINLALAQVALDDQPLHVVDARDGSLSLALAPDAVSGMLTIAQADGEPQRLPLMVWRVVRVDVAPEISRAVSQLEWLDQDIPLQ